MTADRCPDCTNGIRVDKVAGGINAWTCRLCDGTGRLDDVRAQYGAAVSERGK